MSAPATTVQGFLHVFFGPGNDIPWSQVAPGSGSSAAKALEPFLREAREDWDRLILPRKYEGKLFWYALAKSPRESRLLREELLAFVGPSHADFLGQHARLDLRDPVDSAVWRMAGTHAFKLLIPKFDDRDRTREALRLLLDVRGRQPSGLKPAPRPPGRILRDFEFATQIGDEDRARSYLEELREFGSLSRRNIAFLDVHVLATFGRWEELAKLLRQGDLVQAQRPTRVTQALVTCVYRTELVRFERQQDPEAAKAHFHKLVRPQFGRIYQSIAGLSGPEVIKSFLLWDATSTPQRTDRREALIERLPPDEPDHRYASSLARLIADPPATPPTTTTTPLDKARIAFAEGHLDRAMVQLTALYPTVAVLELLFRCAAEVGTLEAHQISIAALEVAPSIVLDELCKQPRVVKRIEEAKQRFGLGTDDHESPELPDSWQTWLDRLQHDPNWSRAVAAARQGALEWSVEPAGTTIEQSRSFADRLLTAGTGDGAEAIALAMPSLIESFVVRSQPSAVLVPVQTALLDLLLYSDTRSSEGVRACGLVLEALMRAGMQAATCKRLVDDVRQVWKDLAAFELLDWALDVLEAIVTLQVAPPEAQVSFTVALGEELLRWRDRLDPSQVSLFEQLAREAKTEFDMDGLRPTLPVPTDDGIQAHPLHGKTVAIYSLRIESLRRVGAVLSTVVPSAKVQLYSDKVGSAPLKSASQNADVFVIVTGAAKHAATNFIEDNRPAGAATIRCHATGSAGLLRALATYERDGGSQEH